MRRRDLGRVMGIEADVGIALVVGEDDDDVRGGGGHQRCVPGDTEQCGNDQDSCSGGVIHGLCL